MKSVNSTLSDRKIRLNGFDTTDEHPAFYKSKDSNARDFYVVHAYTPEHFTLLRYLEIEGVVTTMFSTIADKYELQDIVIKGAHASKQLMLITREEYLRYKNVYDNYIKSVHI